MLALSATYPEYLADHLTAYMRNPTFLRLNISDPALLGTCKSSILNVFYRFLFLLSVVRYLITPYQNGKDFIASEFLARRDYVPGELMLSPRCWRPCPRPRRCPR